MKLNKKYLCVVAMLLMVMSSSVAVHADSVKSVPGSLGVESSASQRRDETEWVFRRNPDTGKIEKRLWSITYGVWRTEWEPAT